MVDITNDLRLSFKIKYFKEIRACRETLKKSKIIKSNDYRIINNIILSWNSKFLEYCRESEMYLKSDDSMKQIIIDSCLCEGLKIEYDLFNCLSRYN